MKLRSECGVAEEQLVDLLQAGVGGGMTEAQVALLRHAETCAACAQQLREWEALLGGIAPAPGASVAPAPSAALQQRLFAAVRRRVPLRRAVQAVRLLVPRELQQRRRPMRPAGEARREGPAPAASALRGKMALTPAVPPQASGRVPEQPAAAVSAAHGQAHQPLQREPEQPRYGQRAPQAGVLQAAPLPAQPLRPPHRTAGRRKRSYLFGTAAAAAALLYIGTLCAIHERMGDPAMAGVPTLAQVQADDEILANMGLVVQAKTAQFPVQSRGSERARGVAWVNDDSEEMLLLVEGLPSLPGQDYRVWSVRRDGRTPLGTLRLAAGKAHLHYHGAELHGADAISVSREPADTASGGTIGGAEVAAVKLK